MGAIGSYQITIEELTTALIHALELREHGWALELRGQISAQTFWKHSPILLDTLQIFLNRVDNPDDPYRVDAALVNPRPTPGTIARTRKPRVKDAAHD